MDGSKVSRYFCSTRSVVYPRFTQFSQRTKILLYKNISLKLYSRKGWCLCGVWEMGGERTSSSHIFFREPGGANACTPLQARERRPDRLRVPRSTAILCTLYKSDHVVHIMYSPSGNSPVVTECLIVVPCLRDSLSKHTGSLGTNRKSMAYVISQKLSSATIELSPN